MQADIEDTGSISDSSLCELLQRHLKLDASPHFASISGKHPLSKGGTSRSKLSLEAFITRTQALLELEKDAEIMQTQEAIGHKLAHAATSSRVLFNLRCTGVEGGLLGRTLITLANNKGGGSISLPLPAHKFSTHDLVDLRPSKAAAGGAPPLASGVVYRVKDQELVVAVESVPDEGLEQPIRLEKLANEVTYKRLQETLQQLSKASSHQDPATGYLPEVLFGQRPPRFTGNSPAWNPSNTGLDPSQRAAVSKALAAQDVALIHGPPGTGKTTAVVELILQETARGNRVLAAAASNMAVDNLVERLVKANPKLQVVRVGHPARLLPQVLDSSLEAHVLRSDGSKLAKDCRKEIKAANARIMKLGRKDYAERKTLRAEIRALGKEERQRQQKAVGEVLQRAAVVCATLTGTLSHHVAPLRFDVTVIDEAAQALEAGCWSAILKAPRVVLAGDHLQLPPTIISDSAAQKFPLPQWDTISALPLSSIVLQLLSSGVHSDGLARTLFERLQELYGPSISEMLTVQYRMNAQIMQWSSQELYGNRIRAHESVADHILTDLAKDAVEAGGEEFGPLLLIDTAGCEMEEDAMEEGEDSRSNRGEARLALSHCRRLQELGLPLQDVGVITPYNAQVALLKDQRPSDMAALEIGTVDGFQGREKEAIVISMVRSNPEGTVGFLADNRRMNVAVTRARRHCALVCDTETVSHDPFLSRLVEYFQEHGCYVSAAELV